MKIRLGIHFAFPTLWAILLLLPALLHADQKKLQGLMSDKLDFLSQFEVSRLKGVKEQVLVRLSRELTDRLKKIYLEKKEETLSPEKYSELERVVNQPDFLLDSDQMLELLAEPSQLKVNDLERMEVMAALRLANEEGREGKNRDAKENLRRLIEQELQNAKANKVGDEPLGLLPGLKEKLLALVPEKDREEVEAGFTADSLLKVLESPAARSLDEQTLRDMLAQTRVLHSLLAGAYFSNSVDDDRKADLNFRNAAKKLAEQSEANDLAPLSPQGEPQGEKEERPDISEPDALPELFKQPQAGVAPGDEPFKPHQKATAPQGPPVSAGQGLYAPESGARDVNLGNTVRADRGSFVTRGSEGSGDGAANIAGAKPVGSEKARELLAAIAALNDKGIIDFSIDIFSDLGSSVAKCQATAISKIFDGLAGVCRMKFSTADHCVSRIPESMEIRQLNRSFAVQQLSSASFASVVDETVDTVVIQKPDFSTVGGAGVVGADIAMLHLNTQGPCPDDTTIPTFEVAERAPRDGDGVIVDGHQTLLGGVKTSPEGNALLEVNLTGNSMGIYPGNSGGGSFVLEDGKIKLAGPLSAKFSAARFKDQLGLIAADSPVQAWYREQLGLDTPVIASVADEGNNGVSRQRSTGDHVSGATSQVSRPLSPAL